jgi:type 1 glutamine amidotransferase
MMARPLDILPAVMLTAMGLAGVALAASATRSTPSTTSTSLQPPKKKIVFLAGPKDHGRPGNGRHEYEKDLRALAGFLETSPNLRGIETRVYVGKAPQDLAELQDASAIVIESSSDRDAKETHPLFPQEPTTDRRTYDADTTAYLEQFDRLIKKGVGVAIFHYATWVEHWVARKYYLQWIGGLWISMGSTNPVAEWTMTPKNGDHPILRGVRPWTYRDEVFCRYFLPADSRRTELLIGMPAQSALGPQVAAWAYDRADGGRGFVMGGVDFHDNLKTVEDYRRFLLNGIVWAAGVEVPRGGVQSMVPASAGR